MNKCATLTKSHYFPPLTKKKKIDVYKYKEKKFYDLLQQVNVLYLFFTAWLYPRSDKEKLRIFLY